jgi:5-methylcytosine-specific restriction endonuclease McrA
MDAALRKFVRERANGRCEYCMLPQEAVPYFTFHVEHIRARQHQGSDEPSNLALACPDCNAKKGPNRS